MSYSTKEYYTKRLAKIGSRINYWMEMEEKYNAKMYVKNRLVYWRKKLTQCRKEMLALNLTFS